jgi:hypothetical protein
MAEERLCPAELWIRSRLQIQTLKNEIITYPNTDAGSRLGELTHGKGMLKWESDSKELTISRQLSLYLKS